MTYIDIPCKYCGSLVKVDEDCYSVTCGRCVLGEVTAVEHDELEMLERWGPEELKGYRSDKGLTQQDLALKAKVPKYIISAVEQGRMVCTPELANYLDKEE